MTSSNGTIVRVTGLLCREFTGHKDQWRGALMFSLNCAQQLSQPWRRRWFKTPSRPLWSHCNVKRYVPHVLVGFKHDVACIVRSEALKGHALGYFSRDYFETTSTVMNMPKQTVSRYAFMNYQLANLTNILKSQLNGCYGKRMKSEKRNACMSIEWLNCIHTIY